MKMKANDIRDWRIVCRSYNGRELCGERNSLNHLRKKNQNIIENVKEMFLSVIYPVKCPFCGDILGGKRISSCRTCERKLPFVKEPRCYQCGKPIDSSEEEYCADCRRKKHNYTCGVALWSYDIAVKQAVYRFKYKNQRQYANYFAKELIKRYGRLMKTWDADAVIPVPIHRKRYKQRGYNQAELLAVILGQYIEVPVVSDLVERIKNTRPQKELNDKERYKNLKKAFKITKNVVELKKVIIVDDIYTTGTTVDVMAELLLEAGITDIYVVTLCIGKGY